MTKKIGILTSGGDCPGLNAIIRAVVKCASQKGWEVYGIPYGTDGFIRLEQKKMPIGGFKVKRTGLQSTRIITRNRYSPISERKYFRLFK